MAHTGSGNKRNSSPIGRGSNDSDNDFKCNQCLSDGKETESVVYCLECNEHLCSECRRIHRRIKVSREHFLIHLGCDPSETETEICEEHYGKMVEYFCEFHDALFCSTCWNTDHKTCDNVVAIRQGAAGVKDGKELQDSFSELDRLRSKFQGLVDFKQRQNRDIKKQTNMSKLTIQRLRTQADVLFKQLEQEAMDETNDICDTRIAANTAEVSAYQEETDKLGKLSDTLRVVGDIAGEAQTYITLQRSNQHVERYTDIINDAENNLTHFNVDFCENQLLVKMLNKTKQLGYAVTDYVYVSKPPTPKSPRSSMRKRAIPVAGHSIWTTGDKTTCNITSIAILPDGRLVLADYGNKRLKVFNPSFVFVGQLKVSTRPLSIAILDHKEIIVSSADEPCLFVCSLDGSITQSKQINTNEKYVSLATAPTRDDIFASCYQGNSDGEIHILDKTGHVIGSLGQSSCGLPLIRPSSILLNDSGSLLFINDSSRNCVICVNVSRLTQHSIVFQYTDWNLQLHSGLALGGDGCVYVSSRNGSVHQISSMGDKIHELLDKQSGINAPTSLALCTTQNTLYVAEQKQNSIKMFSLI